METTEISTLVFDFFPYGFIKLMVLAILLMYLVFAAIIVRQENLMSRVVEMSFSPLLRVVVMIHLIASLIVFFLAAILL